MSTPTLVEVSNLSAVAARKGDDQALTVLHGTDRLGSLVVMDPFGYDAEFTPASQSCWETYAGKIRDTVHLARKLRGIATAPARMTTKGGFMVLPDVDVTELAGIEDFDTRCLHVPTVDGQDAEQAIAGLIEALDHVPAKAKAGEPAPVDPRDQYDPYRVLSGKPSTLTYPARVDGAVRLVTITLRP